MARVEREVVHLLSVKRYGSTMLKEHYDVIANFIISTLELENGRAICLNELIEKAKINVKTYNGIHADEIPWYLLNVKQDLEAKNVIQVTVHRGRRQHLHLTKKNLLV